MKFLAFIVAVMIVTSTTGGAALGIQTPARGSVRGVVTKSGKPVSSVWVVVSQSGREKGRSLTGDDGKYYIGPLDNGTYDVVVMKGTSQLFKGKFTLPKDSNFPIKL